MQLAQSSQTAAIHAEHRWAVFALYLTLSCHRVRVLIHITIDIALDPDTHSGHVDPTPHDPMWVSPDGTALEAAMADGDSAGSERDGETPTSRSLDIIKGDAAGHPLGDASVIFGESSPDMYVYVKDINVNGPIGACK